MQTMKHWTAPLHRHTRLGNFKRPVETFLETRIRNDHRLIWMIFFVSIKFFNVFDNFLLGESGGLSITNNRYVKFFW